MKTNFNKIKKDLKVVDRWYSFHPNSFGIKDVGVVVKVSRIKKTADINFCGKILTYDLAHIEEFIVPYKKGMKRKYWGKIIPHGV